MPYATVPAQFYGGSVAIPQDPGITRNPQGGIPPPAQYANQTQYPATQVPLYNNPYPVKSNSTGGLFGVPWLSRGGSVGTSGNLAGAPPFGYSASAGGIPQVPNPGVSAGQAIGSNIGNLGGLGQLSSGIGSINAGLGSQPYIQNLPGYQGLLNKASANTSSLLGGQIPADVLTQLQQGAAERGVMTGAPGSPNANAAYLRALGLTSLGLQQTGQQNFAQLRGQTPTGPTFNPSSMLIDPAMQQQAQAAANLYNAAPNPQAAQNAAMRALQRGLGQGQYGTQPTQSGSLVQDILNRYAPTATGGIPALNPNVPTGIAGTGTPGTYYAPPPVDYANISDEDLYNLMMGELPQQPQYTDYSNNGGEYYQNILDQGSPFSDVGSSDYYDFGEG